MTGPGAASDAASLAFVLNKVGFEPQTAEEHEQH